MQTLENHLHVTELVKIEQIVESREKEEDAPSFAMKRALKCY